MIAVLGHPGVAHRVVSRLDGLAAKVGPLSDEVDHAHQSPHAELRIDRVRAAARLSEGRRLQQPNLTQGCSLVVYQARASRLERVSESLGDLGRVQAPGCLSFVRALCPRVRRQEKLAGQKSSRS